MRNRRVAQNCDVGPFTLSIGFDPEGHPCEMFLVARGKSGTDLDDWLYELGVRGSKMMQGEDFDGTEKTHR